MTDKNKFLHRIVERLQEIEKESRKNLTEKDIEEVMNTISNRLRTTEQKDRMVEMNNIGESYESKVEKPRVFSDEFFKKY
ncbi:hypothetical protein THOM_0750 [Trachipleistophora hominis]|uniref:Uncharacterized protein n=1 Tax=Trachipleistophora hominis TaxID=72359 RepID=L7JYB6_TRAHO|nr:hypothetical protein THOM_0750 [Trachipleistophora hominis]